MSIKFHFINSPKTGLPVFSEIYFSPPSINWNKTMSKEQKSNREDKKKPALSPKEKKAAKKSKKESKS